MILVWLVVGAFMVWGVTMYAATHSREVGDRISWSVAAIFVALIALALALSYLNR
jgi:hypothetical protein